MEYTVTASLTEATWLSPRPDMNCAPPGSALDTSLLGGLPGQIGMWNVYRDLTAQTAQIPQTQYHESNNKSRSIGQETWNQWKQDIIRRYIGDDQTLKQIMDYYKKHRNFHGTKKQWKDQIKKWELKKRLNPQDAAYICQQLRAAERNGKPIRVLFNGVEKTMEDVNAYIRKSTKIHSESELMEHLDVDHVPPHISCETQVVCKIDTSDTRRAEPKEPTTWTGQQSPSMVSPYECQRPRLSDDSFLDVMDPSLLGVQAISSDEAELDNDACREGEEMSDSGSSLDVPMIYSDSAINAVEGTGASLESIPDIVGLISNSPIQTNADPARIEVLVENWLGMSIKDPIGDDDASQRRVLEFLRQCCAVAIHTGQPGKVFDECAQRASAQAVAVFGDIFENNSWDTLSVLHNMVVLLGLHGHAFVPADILRNVRNELHNKLRNRSLSAQQDPYIQVILSALNTLLKLPYSQQIEPTYDLSDLEEMVRLAEKCYEKGSHDQFSLSARYLYAWTLLEMQKNEAAYEILRDGQAECHDVFGRYRFQTITWIATLARAESAIGKKTAAMNTYWDLLEMRIKPRFSNEHPQYWDAQYRFACFLRKHVEASNKSEQQVHLGRLDVARKLQKTLSWRAENLGPHNPISLQNERALRGVMKKLELANADSTFSEIIDKDLSNL